jgi:hypothetical protein
MMYRQRFPMPIVFSFDVRTIALFVALTFFVQGTVIGAQAFLIRDLRQYRGVSAALIANLCVAVGLMLRLFMDRLPGFFTTILSNILLLTGSGLFYIALSQFTGFSYSKSLVIGVIAVALSFLVYFTYWDDDLGMRMITFSLGSVAMVFILIYQLWRTQKTSLQREPDAGLLHHSWNISDGQNHQLSPGSPAGHVQHFSNSICKLSSLVRDQFLLVNRFHPHGESAPEERSDGGGHDRCPDPHSKPARNPGLP